jgi:anti-sigma-K factor RskA
MTASRLDDEHDLLAAEHALGVLHGAELTRARELVLASPEFAEAVDAWRHTLAPIADEVSELPPRPGVWVAIEHALAGAAGEPEKLVQLRRKLRIWKGVSFASVAAAVIALWFAVLPPNRTGVPPANEPAVLVASLSSEQTGTAVSAAYSPASRTVLVSPAMLQGAGGHQHELWIIPPGGEPVPVGLVTPGEAQRLPVAAAIAPHFRGRSTLAISVEPIGGSPTGKPTGPVIATGELSAI